MNPNLIYRICNSKRLAIYLATANTINCLKIDTNEYKAFCEFAAYRYYFITGYKWDEKNRTLTIWFDEYTEKGKRKVDTELWQRLQRIDNH